MQYTRMKDEKNILTDQSSNSQHHHHHCQHNEHHQHHRRKRFCFIGSVMIFTILISYIIVLGATFGVHQKNSLLHGNYIVNSSIIIHIVVNGQNKTLNDNDNDIILKLIEDIGNDDEIYDEEEPNYDTTTAEAPSYEEIDKSIPIEKGPLRIENPEKIPLLREVWKSTNSN